MQRWRATLMSVARSRWIRWGLPALLSACAFVPQPNEWIIVGHTTREEVTEAYGEPDLVMAAAAGETVVYRPRDMGRSAPSMKIPTVQAGPFGTTVTKMETIKRGSGAGSADAGLKKRPDRELRIRYDALGIVQELIQ